MDSKALEALAQRMRDFPTESEMILYRELQATTLNFQFQIVLRGYIPDFYFPKYKKIVDSLFCPMVRISTSCYGEKWKKLLRFINLQF